MDPDMNLDGQLTVAKRIIKHIDDGHEPLALDAVTLAEFVTALDEWMVNGGFPPKRWRHVFLSEEE